MIKNEIALISSTQEHLVNCDLNIFLKNLKILLFFYGKC